MKTPLPLKIVILAFCLFTLPTFAVNIFNGTAAWTSAANWSGGVPVAAQDVEIASGTCTVSAALVISLNSITVDAGATLNITANTTFTTPTLNVAGMFENSNVTLTVTSTNVNVTGAGIVEMANGASSVTNLDITSSLVVSGTATIQRSSGTSPTANVNFDGAHVIETWNATTTTGFGSKFAILINGVNNSVKLLSSAVMSPKSTWTVSSGDTLDTQTYVLGGMTNALGGVVLAAGSVIKIGSTTGLNGNVWSTNGGNSFPAAASYIFSGTANQVTGTLLPGTVSKLTLRNTGALGSNIVTTSQVINVTGSLTLSQGILSTTAANILNLNAGSVSTAGNTDSFVDGPMTKTGNTAFSFPVGGSLRFMPLGMTAPATATNKITVQYTHATPITPFSVLAPLINVSLLEYWTMSETVSTDAVTVTLNWQNGPGSGIYVYNNTLLVAWYNSISTLWNSVGQSAITGVFPGVGSVTASVTITGFNNTEVTFGTSSINNPLPITLTSFNANYIGENNSVLVNWVVASQINNRLFTVEKTIDGINYTTVSEMEGAGTTPYSESYNTTDNDPTPGTSYYRLSQTDFDGTVTHFDPVAVYFDLAVAPNQITVFPNPVSSTSNLLYSSANSNIINITIYDLNGRIVSSIPQFQSQLGLNTIQLPTSGLSSGIYFVALNNSGAISKFKIVKE